MSLLCVIFINVEDEQIAVWNYHLQGIIVSIHSLYLQILLHLEKSDYSKA